MTILLSTSLSQLLRERETLDANAEFLLINGIITPVSTYE